MALRSRRVFVVYDAIVIIEHIAFISKKDSDRSRLAQGATRCLTILSLTISLIAVLIPLLLKWEIS